MSAKNALLFFAIFAVVSLGALGLFFLKKAIGPIIPENASVTATSTKIVNRSAPATTSQTKSKSGGFFANLFNFNFIPTVSIPNIGPYDSTGQYGNNSQPSAKTPEQLAYDVEQAKQAAQKIQAGIEEIQKNLNASPYKGKIRIQNINRGYSYFGYSGNNAAANSEYVTLRAEDQNKEPILITGWRLRSTASGNGADIKEGVYLPWTGIVNTAQTIFLAPGATAYIITGRSPVGYSFRLNECTGYFEQFQNFTPSLPIECPRLNEEELPKAPNALKDKCLDYLDSFPRCTVRTNPLPLDVQPECATFVDNHASYNYCVTNHKDDLGFAKKEWRIFLARDETLWKDRREIVELVDQNGQTVDTYSY